MNSRFLVLPGLNNVRGNMITLLRIALVVGMISLTCPLFAQEVLLPVGNGNTVISLSSANNSAPSNGSLQWKAPVDNQAPVAEQEGTTPVQDNSTRVKLQAIASDQTAPAEMPVSEATAAPMTPQEGSVRLVLFDSTTDMNRLPQMPARSAVAEMPQQNYQVTAPIIPISQSRESSYGKTVPVPPTPTSPVTVKKPTNPLAAPAKSPFGRMDANTKYTDTCPDPKTLPKIKELSYKVVPQPGLFPESCPLPDEYYNRTAPTPITFYWKASNLCHKPVYFEDVQLERYGNTVCPLLEPVISRVRFWLLIPVLPYAMGVTPPNECVYELGYYRPGSCAPHMLNPIPISLRAGLIQAGAVVGAAYLIP